MAWLHYLGTDPSIVAVAPCKSDAALLVTFVWEFCARSTLAAKSQKSRRNYSTSMLMPSPLSGFAV